MTTTELEKNEPISPLPKRTIKVAKALGVCFGVKRALEIAQRERFANEGSVVSLGKLVHNEQAIDRMRKSGIGVTDRLEESKGGTVVLSAHGSAPSVAKQAASLGLRVVDAVCPFVTKVHRQALKMMDQGYQLVLLGDRGHTEVKGIIGAVEEAGGRISLISNSEEAKELPLGKRVALISQTTQMAASFGEIAGILATRTNELRAINTICGATDELQAAAIDLANECDAVIVVGGRMSANTARLRELCERCGTPAWHVETADEIDERWLEGKRHIGVTAGASTPDEQIEQVAARLNGGSLPSDFKVVNPAA